MSHIWKQFGHAGHFIGGKYCRFHLCTQIGRYLISTVGELWFDRSSREIHAEIYDLKWLTDNRHLKGDAFDAAYMTRFGYETLNPYGSIYETMVFKAGSICSCGCGLPSIDGNDLDYMSYTSARQANKGHNIMCLKWDNGKPKRVPYNIDSAVCRTV